MTRCLDVPGHHITDNNPTGTVMPLEEDPGMRDGMRMHLVKS